MVPLMTSTLGCIELIFTQSAMDICLHLGSIEVEEELNRWDNAWVNRQQKKDTEDVIVDAAFKVLTSVDWDFAATRYSPLRGYSAVKSSAVYLNKEDKRRQYQCRNINWCYGLGNIIGLSLPDLLPLFVSPYLSLSGSICLSHSPLSDHTNILCFTV